MQELIFLILLKILIKEAQPEEHIKLVALDHLNNDKKLELYETRLSQKEILNTDYLNDSIVTYRNDRLVVPVKASYKYQIKGIIHDESQSRQTSYVEPDFVIELNSKIYKLKQEEHDEVIKILKG